METITKELLIAEVNRFFLVRDRDGLSAAVDWAKRVIASYEVAIADPDHYASKEPHYTSFKGSIVVLGLIVTRAEEGAIDEAPRGDGVIIAL